MRLLQPKPDSSIKRMGAEAVRQLYMDLSSQMQDILRGSIHQCPVCGEWFTKDKFYTNDQYDQGIFPICRECLLKMATDYDPKVKRRVDNRTKTIRVFSMLDLPFYDNMYKTCVKTAEGNNTDRGKTGYQQMLASVCSLAQFKNRTFADSVFENDDTELGYEFETTRKARREIRKLFGAGYSEADYLFLQDQYDDFRARTQVDSKSQEIYVTQICQQLLEIDKARKAGKDVTKLLSALDSFMASAKLQPKQNVNNGLSDAASFGELIERWENEKPIPEPDPEFKDVNNIGKLIRVYFAGHLSKALGLKNSYSEEYEEELKKYTVTPPQAGENGSSDTYQQLFGNDEG